MKPSYLICLALCACLGLLASPDQNSFVTGNPQLQSIRVLDFSQGDVLFIGDNVAARVYAIKFDNIIAAPAPGALNIQGINRVLAEKLGVGPADIHFNDMAVHPKSHDLYVAVTRQASGSSHDLLFRINSKGDIAEVKLDHVAYSYKSISNIPDEDAMMGRRKARTFTITDIAFTNGEVLVTGLSNEEFASTLRRFPFPFSDKTYSTSLEVYHVSHGKNETHAPINSFMLYNLNGVPSIIAGYACSPLVSFPIADLKQGSKLVGKTFAELGGGNAPNGIIAYHYQGEPVILVGNSRYQLVMINPKEIAGAAQISYPSRERGVSRLIFAEGRIDHIADYNEQFIVMLRSDNERQNTDLHSLSKAELDTAKDRYLKDVDGQAVDIYSLIKNNPSPEVFAKAESLARDHQRLAILNEGQVNTIGYELMGEKKMEDAISVFKFNVKLFPDGFNTYDSLGEAYMENGQSELAIANYKKSLELNPNNTNAVDMLKRLEANVH